MKTVHYAYLHGFGSGPNAYKGVQLARLYSQRHSIHLHQPNLNYPNFKKVTISGALRVLDLLDQEHPGLWRLIGSSMGGYAALRWAQLNPHKVDRLFLLCPGLSIASRWPVMMGQQFDQWQKEGVTSFKNYETNEDELVDFEFIRDFANNHPPVPPVTHPTFILHGTNDEVVPISYSRELTAQYKDLIKMVEVDDDHSLTKSVSEAFNLSSSFFEIDSSNKARL